MATEKKRWPWALSLALSYGDARSWAAGRLASRPVLYRAGSKPPPSAEALARAARALSGLSARAEVLDLGAVPLRCRACGRRPECPGKRQRIFRVKQMSDDGTGCYYVGRSCCLESAAAVGGGGPAAPVK
jgi:hypothetical protein